MTCGVLMWWSRLLFYINGSLFCSSCARGWAYGCQWCHTIPLINRWWYQTRYDALCLQTGREEDNYKLDLNNDAFKMVLKRENDSPNLLSGRKCTQHTGDTSVCFDKCKQLLFVCKKNLHRAPLTHTGGSLLIMFCTFRGIRSAQNAYWSSFKNI